MFNEHGPVFYLNCDNHAWGHGCLFSDADLSLCSYLAVELLGFVGHGDGEFFFVTLQFQILWYTPRVPAGACSAKGHNALGHDLAIGPGDDDLGIKGFIHLASVDHFAFSVLKLLLNLN